MTRGASEGEDETRAKPPEFARSRSWIASLHIDAPTAWAVAARLVQLVASPVTLLLMARVFDPATQGYYFTFGSLLALQSFLELGLSIVITNVASHEWAHLSTDDGGAVVGDVAAHSRLHSLVELSSRWYAAAAVVFLVAVSLGGAVFLGRSAEAASVNWRGPWIAAVMATALSLWLTPFMAVLDGCNQYAVTNRFRVRQAALVAGASWTTILPGGGLWTAAVAAAMNAAVILWLVGVRYRRFYRSLEEVGDGERMHWGREVRPMQWRLAVSAVASYFVFSLYNPVIFASQGAAMAGRMGMTLAAVRALQLLGQAWIDTQVSHFGGLIARRDFRGLNDLFTRRAASSLAVVAGGGGVFLGLVVYLGWLRHPLANRLLDAPTTAVLLAGALLGQFSVSLSAYLRAHKREPVMVLSVVTSVAVGVAVSVLGSRYGAWGAAVGSTAVWAVNVVWNWRIWTRCRREWHGPVTADGPAVA